MDTCIGRFDEQNALAHGVNYQKFQSHFFLEIIYFDRLKRGTDEPPRTIPLTSVWNKKMIQDRMKVEKKRGFGQGIVLDTLTATSTTSPAEDNQKQDTQQQPSSSSSAKDVMGYILAEFNSIAKGVAGHVESLYALVDKANRFIEEVNVPDDIRDVIRSVWSKYSLLQPSMSQPGSSKYTPCFMSQDETIFDEPTFLSELNDVMNKAWANFEAQSNEQFVPPTLKL